MFFSGPLGGEISPQTLTNLSGQLDAFHIFSKNPEYIPDFFVMQEADENGSDGLDIDEFRTAFGQILGKGKNDQQVLQVMCQ